MCVCRRHGRSFGSNPNAGRVTALYGDRFVRSGEAVSHSLLRLSSLLPVGSSVTSSPPSLTLSLSPFFSRLEQRDAFVPYETSFSFIKVSKSAISPCLGIRGSRRERQAAEGNPLYKGRVSAMVRSLLFSFSSAHVLLERRVR